MQLHAGIIIIIKLKFDSSLIHSFTVAGVPRWAHSWLVRVSELVRSSLDAPLEVYLKRTKE